MPTDTSTPQPPSSSKLDTIFKILGSGFLAWITFLINTHNDISKHANDLRQQEIQNSMQYGQFTNSLIQDLIAKDTGRSNIKRDMAFTVLNRTIVSNGNDSQGKKMISDVGYCIISDYYSDVPDHDTVSNMRIVLDIIRERDTATFEKCIAVIRKYYASKNIASQNEVQAIVKQAAKNDTNFSISENIKPARLDRMTLIPSKATVFIQLHDDGDRSTAANFSKELTKANYNVPGIEVVKIGFPNMIKYFNDGDAAAAQEIHDLLKKAGNADLPVKRVYNDKARPGIVEVWYN